MQDPSVRTLADRLDIQELLARYADMVDRRDWTKMDQVFALEATVDFRESGGPSGPFREMMAWLDRALDSWPNNLHLVTNVIIELAGDRASSTSYYHVPIGREPHDGSQYTLTESGRFLDRLIRTSDGWRILARVCQPVVREGRLPDGYTLPR